MKADFPVAARTVRPSRLGDAGSLGEVLRIASSRRFRAASRRRVREGARHGIVFVLLAAVFDLVWLIPLDVDQRVTDVLVNVAIGAVGLLAWSALTRRPRWPAEPTMVVVLATVDVGLAVVFVLDPGMAFVCATYALLMPVLVALVLPWNTVLHLLWLVLHAALVVAGVVAAANLGTAVPVTPDATPALFAGMFAMTSVLSIFGHLSNVRARVVSFVQIERIGRLNREARTDELRLRDLNERLEAQSRTDDLTGLRNRAAMDRDLPMVRARISRFGERWAVVMLDLDHFKPINDLLGHFAGDAVLRRVASTIRSTTRGSDLCFRFGGEEFLVLAQLGPGDDVSVLGERIRSAIAGLEIDHPANPPFGRVTISIGATVVSRRDLAVPVDAWFRAADAALYEAKRRGRNVVVVAPDPTATAGPAPDPMRLVSI